MWRNRKQKAQTDSKDVSPFEDSEAVFFPKYEKQQKTF